jgi:uncharacterized membrane protein (DUF373 family)
MHKFIKHIEKTLVWGIILVMFVILILAFLDILYEIREKILEEPFLIIDANGLMDLLSIFLILLIGLELLETVKTYLDDDKVHVEFIILLAIIAIARKAIVWDFETYGKDELLSLAGMILALGITYFLVKKCEFKVSSRKNKDASSS